MKLKLDGKLEIVNNSPRQRMVDGIPYIGWRPLKPPPLTFYC